MEDVKEHKPFFRDINIKLFVSILVLMEDVKEPSKLVDQFFNAILFQSLF